MRFSVHGPFEIRRANGLIDDSVASKRQFWADVEEDEQGLSAACGCYIFAVKARGGALPWYVGLTTRRTFCVESLGPHQVNHYNHAIAQKNGVAAQIFLLAKRTPRGRFAKPSKRAHIDIEFLETFLFGIALNRNGELRNIKNTRFLKDLVVPGIINSPKRGPAMSERLLKSSLGI